MLYIIAVNIAALTIGFFYLMRTTRFLLEQNKSRKTDSKKNWEDCAYKAIIAHEKISKLLKIKENANDDMTILRADRLITLARKRFSIINLRSSLKFSVYANDCDSLEIKEYARLDLLCSYEKLKLALLFDEYYNADNSDVTNKIGTNIEISTKSIDLLVSELNRF